MSKEQEVTEILLSNYIDKEKITITSSWLDMFRWKNLFSPEK